MPESNHNFDDFEAENSADSEHTLTVAHVDEEYDVYGGRDARGNGMLQTEPPHRGWLGNPYPMNDYETDARTRCIRDFAESFADRLRESPEFALAVLSLRGRVVACHCRSIEESEPACHLDTVAQKLTDGTVLGFALHGHDIALTDAETERAKDPEELIHE